MKNRRPECVELQSRMLDYFSEADASALCEIEKHCQNCQICAAEFEQINSALTRLQTSSENLNDAVPGHLLAVIEARLDSVEQFRPAESEEISIRSALMLQYSFLSLMAVIIWLTLLFAQPFISELMSTHSLLTAIPLIDEYGLFMVFFIAGGLFAMLSSPILIRSALKKDSDEKNQKLSTRFFSTGIRFFAC